MRVKPGSPETIERLADVAEAVQSFPLSSTVHEGPRVEEVQSHPLGVCLRLGVNLGLSSADIPRRQPRLIIPIRALAACVIAFARGLELVRQVPDPAPVAHAVDGRPDLGPGGGSGVPAGCLEPLAGSFAVVGKERGAFVQRLRIGPLDRGGHLRWARSRRCESWDP